MSEARIVGCNFTGANFSESNLEGLSVDKATKLDEANFSNANLRNSSLSGSFRDSNFSSTDIQNSFISSCDMRGSRFFKAKMSGDDFVMQNVDLRGANLSTADLRPSVFEDVIYDQFTVWPQGFNPRDTSSYTCIYRQS